MTYEPMADAAFAANIPPGFQVAAGYYPGRNDYHAWPPSDWNLFPGYRLPITVPRLPATSSDPGSGTADGAAALAYLRRLRIPDGVLTVVDAEAVIAVEYLLAFAAQLQQGYKLWTYGSESTVFHNPPFNGYWVASYGITMQQIDALMAMGHVRAVQYAAYPAYDASLVKQWTEGEMWHG